MKNKIHNTNKKWWEAVKEVLPERFLVINAYIIKEKKRSQIKIHFASQETRKKRKKFKARNTKKAIQLRGEQ